jgi:hypothetical protein
MLNKYLDLNYEYEEIDKTLPLVDKLTKFDLKNVEESKNILKETIGKVHDIGKQSRITNPFGFGNDYLKKVAQKQKLSHALRYNYKVQRYYL